MGGSRYWTWRQPVWEGARFGPGGTPFWALRQPVLMAARGAGEGAIFGRVQFWNRRSIWEGRSVVVHVT
jgi:hypothetical protein